MVEQTKVGITREAYRGAPYGYSHVWPDFVKHPATWSREHWSFDDSQVIRRRREHKPITTEAAMDIVTQMLNKLTEQKGK